MFATLDSEANSMTVIMKHLVGNMRPRSTYCLSSTGEKLIRDRGSECEGHVHR